MVQSSQRALVSAVVPEASSPRRLLFSLLALTLIGYIARVWHLGVQSLWLDEALSVVFARPGLRDIYVTLVTEDIHPPLYYVVLHFWMGVAGSSEFAVRYLSVLFGVPAISATYVLGSALFRGRLFAGPAPGQSRGTDIGLVGAVLVTLSPFLIYYSQEARMYSALATFGILSSYFLWKVLREPRPIWFVGYVLATSALLYTQYFGGLILAFQGTYVIGLLTISRRRAPLALAAMAAVLLTYLPWAPGAYQQMQRLFNIPDFWKGDFQLTFMLSHLLGAFALGHADAFTQLAPLAVVAAIVVVIGFGFLAIRAFRTGGGELYVLAYLLVPLILLYVIVSRDPKFTERYLIMIAPPFYLVIGLALVSTWHWARSLRSWNVKLPALALVGLVGFTLVAASVSQIWRVYVGPEYRKDDNRAAVSYIEQHQQPGDVAVLMMNTYQSYVYYSNGSVPWLPLQPGNDLQQAADGLNSVSVGHRRIWLLEWNPEWADPSGYVRQSISQAYRELPVNQEFTGLELKLYLVDPSYHFVVRTTPSVASPANFGNKLQLLGYDLNNTPVVAGSTDQIAFYWSVPKQTSNDYIISVRVTDGRFYWWRQDDRPAAFNFPTMYWRDNQVVRGVRNFQVPAGTPPGTYYLEVGVYGQGVGSDLSVLTNGQVAQGTSFRVASIQVERPVSSSSGLSAIALGQVLGTYGQDLRLLGAIVQTPRALQGGSVDVTLTWQALQSPAQDYRVQLVLRNGTFDRVVDDDRPNSGKYATNVWRPNEVVVDRHQFILPSDAPPGQGTLFLRLIATEQNTLMTSDRGNELSIGSIQILDHKRLTTAPQGIQTTSDVQIGGFARLVGSSLSSAKVRRGDVEHLTLYWGSIGNSGETSYTVFVHLLDGENLVKAGQDHPPGDGNEPTTGWIPGEYILDHYDLTIGSDVQAGVYQIEVGLYDPSTGGRLPVIDNTGQISGDRVILGTVQVQ